MNLSVASAILAALLYALSTPLSKILLTSVSSTMMAAFLYLGAGIGMLIIGEARKIIGRNNKEKKLRARDIPYTIAMVILDIAAPICLMKGLEISSAASVSLLNNFEIVATSLIAYVIFKERISKRLWCAIVLITLSSIILSYEGIESFSFSKGSMLVLLAAVLWGFENNCTRAISDSDPLEIVVIKGFGSGVGSLITAMVIGESVPPADIIWQALLLGFASYGLSIFFYVYAQRKLGAARTSAYYALSPFIGVILSLVILSEVPHPSFYIALIVMAVGTYLAS